MRRFSHLLLGAATAALLVTSAASPADARRYRHWDRHDGIDVGDVILGAIIIGGIAAIASAASKSNENNGTIFGRDRDRERGRNTESAAVDACADAAERRARDAGRDARVTEIGGVERQGDSFRVRGTIEYRAVGGWDDRNRNRDWKDTARFTCTYSYGRIDDVWIDDGYAWR